MAVGAVGREPQGGGGSGTEWLPTAKWPPGAEAVNRRSTHLKAKKRGAVNFKLRTK